MRRRKFIALLGGAAAAWPLPARAQRTTRPIVGFLNSASADKYAYLAAAFRQGLNDLGFVDGQNITIEYRWAAGQYDRLSEMAADLVRREAAVIAVNTPAVMPAKKATSTIPIVFFTAADSVEAGFVASLNRPGGNLTGISGLQSELGPKRLELLHELVPKATTIALLVNPNNVDVEKLMRDVEATGRNLGLEIQVLRAGTEGGLNGVFARLADTPGSNPKDSFCQVSIYAGRILRGEKPADLPVQQPTKFELVINLKSAKVLGVTIPPTLLARADEVIE
jgi:putative ABC transport system substrate-binding protein